MAKKKRAQPAKQNTAKATPTSDAFSNPAARTGFGTMDLMQATSYPLTRLTQNYQLLTSLYRDNWIVQNVVTTIPNDIIRKWFTIKSSIAPEYLNKMARLERQTQIRQKILSGMYWGRLYGGAAGVILIRGQEDLSVPLDLETIMPDSFLGLMILDRWNGVFPGGELVTDPSDPDFGLPAYYAIRNVENDAMAANVHHSRIVRFTGRELPWMEQITELYWGESEIEAVYNEAVRRDNVAANIAGLTFKANINTMETDGLDQMLGMANVEMQRRFWNVLAAQSMMESNFGIRLINKGDAIHNTQYTFTGLPEVYDRIMMDVAGAARTPVTKLFGRSPAGMNATGESDMQNYYDYVDGIRETNFRPIVERLLPVMALSAWGEIPDDLDIDFPPMWTPDARENAEIVLKKAQAIRDTFQAGLMQADTAQKELKMLSEETGVFGSLTDEEIAANAGKSYADVTSLHDPLLGYGLGGLSGERDTNAEQTEA